ncbi:hypothetical protein RQP53_07720 [Paucibacter sp. APW11]|uniref:Carboxypeptidase regulatory-like domain-containing protein n=1 Tax=Roseateles aquae TaxID=3077235 RepID=A0ABU3P9A5_9BURK|nr:hypothetical protein [Paucibacter sp. APW11]MDT8999153.1 hypothetical protein [Paucibacter sp. APW11]
MSSNDSFDSEIKRATFKAQSQQRVMKNAQLGQMAQAFASAASELPGVQTLQAALIDGLASSQAREAKRLASRFGAEDARTQAAAARATRYTVFAEETATQRLLVERAVKTFESDGRFSGYVYDKDGAPASGYLVQLDVRAPSRQLELSRKASTGSDGYFEIDLAWPQATGTEFNADSGIKPGSTKPRGSAAKSAAATAPSSSDGGLAEHERAALPDWQSTLLHWVENLNLSKAPGINSTSVASSGTATSTSTPPENANSASAAGTGASASSSTGSASADHAQSRVQVLDSSGKLVYQDPLPPAFDTLKSEFRLYSLANS